MTRRDYILHLDKMRKGVRAIIECDDAQNEAMGRLSDPTPLEGDRMKKTRKMLEDLADRLYEDGAVSERVCGDMIMKGRLDQAEFSFPVDGGVARVKRAEPANEEGAAK